MLLDWHFSGGAEVFQTFCSNFLNLLQPLFGGLISISSLLPRILCFGCSYTSGANTEALSRHVANSIKYMV